MQKRPAIFFDRDRTLIGDAPAGLSSLAAHAPEHLRLLPGAVEALRLAQASGYLVVIVTNQPGPAKGQYSRAQVQATNDALVRLLSEGGAAVDAVYVCEHHELGGPGGDPQLIGACECRKPKPGLLLRAARELDIDLTRSAMIGDHDRDMEAGRAAGVRCLRVGENALCVADAVRAVITKGEAHAVVH